MIRLSQLRENLNDAQRPPVELAARALKLRPEEIPALLELGDRRLTGPTMPPQGLYLNRVWYDGAVGKMFEADGPRIFQILEAPRYIFVHNFVL